MSETEDTNESDVNISKLRELAVRGKEYREEQTFPYLGEELTIFVKPIVGIKFLPIAAVLEEKLDMDAEEAQEKIEEEADLDNNEVDTSQFDQEFVEVMADIAVRGIDTTQGDVAGETVEGLEEIFGISDNEENNIGLIGGTTLLIAEAVLDISSNAEKAEKFRRDGGSE
jgi:hypothetical protein